MDINTKEDIISAKCGNKDKLSELVEKNNGLIWSIVKRFLGRGYEAEDLYQIGAIGLIKSIKRFDESYDVKLSTFAVPYILGEIKRFIRDDGIVKISRSIKELSSKIRDIQVNYGENITISKISELLNVSEEDINLALESMNLVESIDECIYDDGKREKIEIIGNVNEEGKVVDKITLNKLIDELDEREKEVIILRYYKDKTQVQVAKIMGISQVQISRIEKKILLKFREKLE